MCKLILAALLAITATKEYVDRQDGALEAEIATNTYAIAANSVQIATNAVRIAALETGKQDAISDLETIRSGAALGATALQEHQSLTNYFTKGESDGRYLQSYTETDPTVPSWAKSSTKPTYTLNEVAPNSENWLGVQGNAGRIIKILAQGAGSSPAGGVQVTASTLNNNNTTTYAYSGVAVKRNGVNTDYLWDTTSASGIVRRAELGVYATTGQVAQALSGKLDKTGGEVTGPLKLPCAEFNGTYTHFTSVRPAFFDNGVHYLAFTSEVTSATNALGQATATALAGKLGNTGDQNLNGDLSFWGGNLAFDFEDAVMTPVISLWNGLQRIEFPSRSGQLALLSDIDLATNALDTAISGRGYLTEHQSLTNIYTKAEVDAAIAGAAGGGVTAVSVAAGGTFGPGNLEDGKVEMWRVTCAGAYTPSSSWHLIGYGAWPAAGSTWQCTVWRIGSAYYCNIIVVE